MAAINHISEKKIAQITTTVYVVLCLFFLFALRCNPPEAPFENQGVIINLGFTESGESDNVPTAPDTDLKDPTPPTPTTATTASQPVEESVTQDFEQTVVASPKKASPSTVKTETTEETVEEVIAEVKPKVNPTALFSSDKVNPNQGTDKTPGDKGNPAGSLESDIYKDIAGNALGSDGKGWGLTGRGLKFKPEPVNESNKYGTVVVRIYVDKNGDVKKAEFTNFNSTTTDSYLVNLSVKEAYKVRFTPAPIDRDYQIGYVTFKYVAQ
jgi:periplasmic protein TonB